MKWWILILLFFCSTAGAFQSIVILPLSNRSGQEQFYWLGEGFAESLTQELMLHDAIVLPRSRRLSAYDELHLPYTGELSRATMLKIGKSLSADYVIFGSYNLKDSSLDTEVKVIRTATSELSTPIQAIGSLDRLYQVQAALREGLIKYFGTRGIKGELDQTFNEEAVPLHAYELYIKGLLEGADAERVKFFQKAIAAYPGYPQATFRLGVSLSRLQKYAESTAALKSVTFAGSYADRASFLIGMNAYNSSDYQAAHDAWLELSKTRTVAPVYNNVGLALLKKEDPQGAGWYLSKAVELNPTQPDYHFNLASSYVQRGYDKQAVSQFREVVQRSPKDFQSLYLIQKLLERDPDPQLKDLIAKRVQQLFQDTLPDDQKGKFPEQYNSVIQLVRTSPQLLSEEESTYEGMAREKEAKDREGIVKAYQIRAAGYLDKDDPASAVLEIKKGVSLSPLDWYLHFLWGRSLYAQKNEPAAISALEFSIWCQDNIDSNVLLAEIYRDAEKYPDAKQHVQRALALDPQNKKALEIWGRIWDKQ